MTETELNVIAALAMIGLKRIPKIIALPVVNMTSGGFARLHLHAANRIDHYVTPLAYLASPIYSEGMCDSRSSRGELGRVEAQGCSRFNIPRSMFLFVSDFEH